MLKKIWQWAPDVKIYPYVDCKPATDFKKESEAMMTRDVWLVVVALLMLSVKRAGGHHSFAAEFDDSRTIQVQGVVTEFRLVNPHATMFMNVSDEAGKTVKWEVEFAGRLNLAKGGWTPSTIKAR